VSGRQRGSLIDMATSSNLFAPSGLIFARNFISGANTYQANQFKIKQGYSTAIGVGDLVKTGTGGNQGYIVPALLGDTNVLGVFVGVLPYYDNTAQQTMHGLIGSWPGASANASSDVSCLVISDPFAVFRAQVSASTSAYFESWRGQNINFLTGTNGAPNIAGVSTLALDFSTLATTATLPFRVVGNSGVTGGPQDPGNNNPWIEVRINTSEVLSATGI
jgi:hypothetical protein